MITPQELIRDSFGTIIRKINTPSGTSTTALGNVILIDDINGNDTTGTINGLPFKTVEAAIAYINTYSLTEVTMWIMPGRYLIASGFTMPATCSMRGLSLQVCSITLTTAVSATMITMGENSRIEDITLNLISTSDTANLVLIALPGTTSITSKIRQSVLNVTNSSVSTGSTTNVYGFYVTGESSLGPATFSFSQTRSTTLNLRSNGGGNKYGLYLPSGGTGAQIAFRDSNIYVAAPRDLASTGMYVGVCCENINSQFQARTSSISGEPYKSSPTNPAVRLLSQVNLTRSGLQTIQGITLLAGDRILLVGQSTRTQNGIWVASSGTWTRPVDLPSGSNASGVWVQVNEGTFALQRWLCISYPATVDTNNLTWRHTYGGVDVKLPVMARYTGGVPSGSRPDQGSYTPTDGDRLFLDQATSAVNNGIWVYNSTGAWTRDGDMPVGASSLNAYIIMIRGTEVGLAYSCTTTGTVGTDALTFVLKYTGSDILQKAPSSGSVTGGILLGPGVDLITKSAGGLPFTCYTRLIGLIYGYRGNIPNGTRYLWPGIQTNLDTTQNFVRFPQDTLVNGISISSRNTDLGTTIVKATVLKSLSGVSGEGIQTPISVSLTDGITQAENFSASMWFERGSFLALRLDSTAPISPGDLTIEIDAF